VSHIRARAVAQLDPLPLTAAAAAPPDPQVFDVSLIAECAKMLESKHANKHPVLFK
jgi:hypothetical protein